MALKQLQEGAQLARPLPLPAELLWRKAPSPEGVRGSHLLWFQGDSMDMSLSRRW